MQLHRRAISLTGAIAGLASVVISYVHDVKVEIVVDHPISVTSTCVRLS